MHGRVQGVFFRDSVMRRAGARRLGGWVRNLADGTVEAVFEGNPDDIENLVEFCRVGPPAAQVTGLDVYAETPEGLTVFALRSSRNPSR